MTAPLSRGVFCKLCRVTSPHVYRRHMGLVNNVGKPPVKPVPMSYTSVESTIPSQITNQAPVIIMHALMGSKGHWNAATKALHAKTGRKVFAVDARNHGDSAHAPDMSISHLVEDIRQFLLDNKVEKAVLIGHEMGGQAAMVTALVYPDLVDKLVVVDTSPVSTLSSLYMMPRYLAGIDNLSLRPNITLSVARRSADRQLQLAIPDKEQRRALLTNLVHANNSSFKWRMNLTALARNFITVTTFPSMYNKLKFPKPTLFLCGEVGNVKPVEYPDIRRMFPEARFEKSGRAGPCLHLRSKDVFLDLVTDFLKEP